MEEIRYDNFNISMLSAACLRTCLFPSCRKYETSVDMLCFQLTFKTSSGYSRRTKVCK